MATLFAIALLDVSIGHTAATLAPRRVTSSRKFQTKIARAISMVSEKDDQHECSPDGRLDRGQSLLPFFHKALIVWVTVMV